MTWAEKISIYNNKPFNFEMKTFCVQSVFFFFFIIIVIVFYESAVSQCEAIVLVGGDDSKIYEISVWSFYYYHRRRRFNNVLYLNVFRKWNVLNVLSHYDDYLISNHTPPRWVISVLFLMNGHSSLGVCGSNTSRKKKHNNYITMHDVLNLLHPRVRRHPYHTRHGRTV